MGPGWPPTTTHAPAQSCCRSGSFEEKGLQKLDTWDPPHGVVVSERSALLLSQQRVDRNSGLALSPNLTARSQPPRQTGSVPGVRSPAMGTGGARTHCSRPRHSRPNAPDAGPLSTSAPAHVGVEAERVHVSPSPSPPPRTGLCFPSGTMWSRRAGATGSAAPPSLWRQGHKPCSGGTRGHAADGIPNSRLELSSCPPRTDGQRMDRSGRRARPPPHLPEAAAGRRAPAPGPECRLATPTPFRPQLPRPSPLPSPQPGEAPAPPTPASLEGPAWLVGHHVGP